MWGDIQSTIMLVAEVSWVAFVAALIISALTPSTDKSIITALSVWCVADLISTAGSPTLYRLIASGTLEYATWHLAFIILNCSAILCIHQVHKRLELFMTKFAVQIIGLLLIMSFMHILLLLDWVAVNFAADEYSVEIATDYQNGFLAQFYQYGLMTVKLYAIYHIAKNVGITRRSSV